ncbi:histidinol-phosphate transaminase [Candidatus Parabeggiatoa sp. HSG14]|uniref:histidinol-phosphate transaminase n=1 Tax=Candidatus Parabeggiatoa sp. HSG14 TaxID=3055593 RepID=UPI0025A7A51D|nr:histidinol-phosphate transaminase [Thiotrichales bacterium HSG14]
MKSEKLTVNTGCDFFQLATLGVQGLQPYQPGKPIEELEREYGIKNVIKLASNENPLGISPRVFEAVQANLKDIARYPDGNGFALKKALAQKHSVEMDMITLGNGSNDVLELIARAFVTPEHSVVFSEHAFAVYPLVTQAISAKAIVTPAKNWGHDLTAMQAAICEDTRLIFIANPNNPTGTWVDRTSLKAFLNVVPKDVIVVIDEAYYEYAIENPDYPDSLEWLSDYPNLVTVRTFSKAYGLAGLRVGYSISHPDVANLLNRVRQPFNVNNIALIAATTALTDNEYLEKSIALNREGMQQLTQVFDEMKLQYIDSVCNFVSVEVGDGAAVYESLLCEGIIVRPIGGGYKMPQHLRVSIGTKAENEQFIKALRKVLNH